ncbi:MAG: hypothetical protein CM1200mP30_31610 [Pseudomonadota bacterium]|nr:MAG: hypothetical protein CM1200mP30_31610 [Pseudomonadota bacterium]
MTEIPPLKYLQWRPIGVCDSGSGKERKARMFSKSDLARVTAPDVNRGNWRQNQEVIQLIVRYANEVAKLSTLTEGMYSPEISEIKLVGAILGLDQTPILNQESSDGKVQFFQVIFREGKSKETSLINWKKWLKFILIAAGSIIALILIYLAIIQVPKFPDRGTKRNESCSSNRQKKAYAEEIQSISKLLLMDLSRLPEWSTFREARVQCTPVKLKLLNQEQRLIQCYLTVRNRVNDLPATARPDLGKIESCVEILCSRGIPYLSFLCGRL